MLTKCLTRDTISARTAMRPSPQVDSLQLTLTKGRTMKKLFMIAMAAVFSMAMVTPSFAQATGTTEKKEEKKAEKAEKKADKAADKAEKKAEKAEKKADKAE